MAEDLDKIFSSAADCAFAFQHHEHGAFFAVDPVATEDDASLSIFAPGFYGGIDGSGMWRDFSAAPRIYFQNERPLSDATATAFARERETGLVTDWKEDKSSWRELCGKVEERIADGSLEKVVPARFRAMAISGDRRDRLQAGLLHRLLSGSSKNAFKFCYRSGSSTFFGATPELLFSRMNGKIFVPAIAGTRWGEPGDERLGQELMASKKDRHEHAVVVDGIRAIFTGLGLAARGPREPQILNLGPLLHLHTPIETDDPGKEALPDLVLLNALHPTAAIGGHPRAAAFEFLRKNEGWDRGLFASPLLIQRLEKKQSICLVAIRSALLTNDALYQFAGAGYVKGSSMEKEWEETGAKMKALEQVIFG